MNIIRRLFNNPTNEELKPTAEPLIAPETLPNAMPPPLVSLATSTGEIALNTDTLTTDITNDRADDPLDAPVATAIVTKPLDPDSVSSLNLEGATRELVPDQLYGHLLHNHLTFGVASHVGAVRSNNQDAAFTLFSAGRSADEIPDFGLFIVADGMGGHHDGEKASALVARVIAAQVTKSIFMPIIQGDNISQNPISELLINAVEKANADLNVKVPEGGTTLSSCLVIGGMAYVAHVGDSRIYLAQRDTIEQITRDHSLVQRLIELDQLTPEEARDHPQHNVLYRALGQNESVEVDTLTRRLPPRSRLLICSDGLWNLVEDHELLDVIRQFNNPQEACNKLIAMANMRGGVDNITVVLLYMPG
ncbi:MAG: PP2C family serine/threonine-protein phosphatase [Chloroflexota bacterium]|nr:PP2C family serine/threonine-protein phosphatase [Chloroflexota bacterium]